MLSKLVFANLKHRPVRTALSILAIGVEVTMMLTVVGLSKGMLEDSANRARGAGADIFIRPGGSAMIGGNLTMPEGIVSGYLERVPHVVAAIGQLTLPTGGVSSVTGLDLADFQRLSGGFDYAAGGPIQDPEHEILVDEHYARQDNVSVGDEIEILNRPWRVAGIIGSGKLARRVIDLSVLQKVGGQTGKITQALVKLDDPANLDAVMDQIKRDLPDYQAIPIEEFVSMFTPSNVPGVNAFIGVVIGLSVIVGFLMVFLSLYTAVLERTREIGILKSLGASPAYIVGVLMRETAMLAAAGAILGIIMTYGTQFLIETFVPASLAQKIVPEWWPIAGAIAIAGAMLGAAYPGWKAAKQDAIEALSYE